MNFLKKLFTSKAERVDMLTARIVMDTLDMHRMHNPGQRYEEPFFRKKSDGQVQPFLSWVARDHAQMIVHQTASALHPADFVHVAKADGGEWVEVPDSDLVKLLASNWVLYGDPDDKQAQAYRMAMAS